VWDRQGAKYSGLEKVEENMVDCGKAEFTKRTRRFKRRGSGRTEPRI
jgi:hypothetical protein